MVLIWNVMMLSLEKHTLVVWILTDSMIEEVEIETVNETSKILCFNPIPTFYFLDAQG